MKKYLIIKADTNDADYVTAKNEISDEDLEMISPVIQAIQEFDTDESIKYQKYNWWSIDGGRDTKPQYMSPYERYVKSGKCSEEAMDYFMGYVPYFEGGIHTIESIELLEVVNETKLL